MVGGPGSGRPGSLHNTFGYHRLGLKGVTKKHTIHGHRIRLGPRYPDSYIDTSAGRFALDWTPCNFGGHRVWFLCRCGKRTSTMFAPYSSIQDKGGKGNWACRHCHEIEYESQYQGPISKKIARCWRIAHKLGLDSILVVPTRIEKPKGMHQKTFERLLEEFEEAQYQMEYELGAWLAKRGELRRP
jgi:Zn-finger protein